MKTQLKGILSHLLYGIYYFVCFIVELLQSCRREKERKKN